MELVIHIGTEKTGTTTIQDFLDVNREELARHGYYFLKSPGETNNRALPSICMRDERTDDFFVQSGIDTDAKKEAFRDRKISELHSEIQSLPAGVHTVIASSEHFHSRLIHPDEVERVHALFSGYFSSIKVVVYLRRQVDTAVSLYSTALKAGQDVGLRQFVLNRCKVESHYFNYDSFLSKWANVFDHENLVVRIFDKNSFVNGNLIDDFLDCVGPSLNSLRSLNRKISTSNESINPFGQVLLRFINKLFPRFSSVSGFNQLNSVLALDVLDICKGKGLQLPVGLCKEVQSQFDQSNLDVKNRYFPKKDFLFPLVSATPQDRFIGEEEEQLLDRVIDALHPLESADAVLSESQVDLLRDCAIALEGTDITKSYALMQMAQSFRPEGPFINKKVDEYSRILSSSNRRGIWRLRRA